MPDPHFANTPAYFKEVSAGVTPSSGQVALYAKTDGLLYSKDDTGAEVSLVGLTTGVADGRYALQSATGNFATNSSVVSLTGDQDVSGIKNFFSRPTVAGTGVLLSGESITTQPNDANLIIGLSLFL